MSRYIDADSAKEIYLSKSAGEQLDRVPTADVQEVKHGKWIDKGHFTLLCSNCENYIARNLISAEHINFCPNCGAKMDGE